MLVHMQIISTARVSENEKHMALYASEVPRNMRASTPNEELYALLAQILENWVHFIVSIPKGRYFRGDMVAAATFSRRRPPGYYGGRNVLLCLMLSCTAPRDWDLILCGQCEKANHERESNLCPSTTPWVTVCIRPQNKGTDCPGDISIATGDG